MAQGGPHTEAREGTLLSLKDLTRYLSCSRTFAAKLIADGTFPSAKIGGIRRVRRSDVDEYVEARLEKAGR